MLKLIALSLALLSATARAELICEIDTADPTKHKINYDRHLYIGPVHNDEMFVVTPKGRLIRESQLMKMTDREVSNLDQSLYIQISDDDGQNRIAIFTMDHSKAATDQIEEDAAATSPWTADLHLYIGKKKIGISCMPKPK